MHLRYSSLNRSEAATGILSAIAFFFVDETLFRGGIGFVLVVATLTIIALIAGSNSNLVFRSFATAVFYYFGFKAALVGRTMAPYLTWETLNTSLTVLGLLGALPFLALSRIWHGRSRSFLMGLFYPSALVCALLVAHLEEVQFVLAHPSGARLTPRWTVEFHGLSYDAEQRILSGSGNL